MTDIADLKETIAEIKVLVQLSNDKTDATMKELFKLINGNGHIGLTTQAHLNKQSIKRAWWMISAISLSILGVAGYIIRCGIHGGA